MTDGEARELVAELEAEHRAKVAELERELAAAQAREKALRDRLEAIHWHRPLGTRCSTYQTEIEVMAQNALSIPHDDTTLREMIEAAKMEEREGCADACDEQSSVGPVCNELDAAHDRAVRLCVQAIRARKG